MQQVETLEKGHSGRSARAARQARRRERSKQLAADMALQADTKESPVVDPLDICHADDSTTASEAEHESSCCTPINVAEEKEPDVADAAEVVVPKVEAHSAEESSHVDALLPQLADEKIIYGLAKLLKHMAESSKPSALNSGFRSARLPSVSLSGFAARMHRFFKCTDECFVLCLVYIDRVIKLHPDFEVSDLTCHRLLLVGGMVAAKFHDDNYASNEYYAKVGGIDVQEVNALEREFLQLLNWRLFVGAPEYDWYLKSLRAIS